MYKNSLPYLAKFSNKKFKIAFEHICSRLEEKSEEFIVEDVKQSYANAKAHIKELQILRSDKKGPHTLTPSICEKRDLRHKYLLSIKGRVAYILKSPLDAEVQMGLLLHAWLNRFKDDFLNPSIDDQSEMVRNMNEDVLLNPSISEAFDDLMLARTWEQIQGISAELQRLKNIRENDRVALVLKGLEVRQLGYDKMKMLYNTIETAIKLEKGDVEKHLEYLRIINVAIADTKALHLNSKTRRINAAEKAAEEEKENAIPEDGEQSNSTQSNGMQKRSALSFIPTNETSVHNDLPNQLAAMQSKTIEGGVVSTIPVNGDQEHDTAEIPEIPVAKQDASTNGSDRES